MNTFSRRGLASLALGLALGCAGRGAAVEAPGETASEAFDRLERRIRRSVEDSDRRERAQAKLDELRGVLVTIERLAYAWRTESHVALGTGDGPEVLDTIIERFNSEARKQLHRAAQLGKRIPAALVSVVVERPLARRGRRRSVRGVGSGHPNSQDFASV